MKQWFAVATQPRKEARARANLLNQHFDVYLPSFKKMVRHARRQSWGLAPLFPGYLFVWMDPGAARWRAINSTVGVNHLVSQNDRPVPIDESVIAQIHDAEDGAGHVQLHELFPFSAGDEVRFLEGPLAESSGKVMEVSDQDRVAVLLKLLGREIEVAVRPGEIVRAAP